MIVLKGKYNTATLYTDTAEQAAITQIKLIILGVKQKAWLSPTI